jgi:hypothetical protein
LSECPLAELQVREVRGLDCPAPLPNWRPVRSSRRDVFAEMAGY